MGYGFGYQGGRVWTHRYFRFWNRSLFFLEISFHILSFPYALHKS